MVDEVSAGMRRLPVYMVLDCSGSMSGEPIEAVRMGLRALVSDLQGDPQALETAWLSVISFDSSAKPLLRSRLAKKYDATRFILLKTHGII